MERDQLAEAVEQAREKVRRWQIDDEVDRDLAPFEQAIRTRPDIEGIAKRSAYDVRFRLRNPSSGAILRSTIEDRAALLAYIEELEAAARVTVRRWVPNIEPTEEVTG